MTVEDLCAQIAPVDGAVEVKTPDRTSAMTLSPLAQFLEQKLDHAAAHNRDELPSIACQITLGTGVSFTGAVRRAPGIPDVYQMLTTVQNQNRTEKPVEIYFTGGMMAMIVIPTELPSINGAGDNRPRIVRPGD